MNIWHDIAKERIKEDEFYAVIEISMGSKNKYELDKETGMLLLDRILFTATHYPANYGFIPRTYSDDGDPLDVLVLCSEPIAPMSLVKCYPIGVVDMRDEGDEDKKIIAIPFSDPIWSVYKNVEEIPPNYVAEIRHFFGVYKQLEGKTTVVLNIFGREKAMEYIKKDMKAYDEKFRK
ncbi:MAG: inorganic diphosphatase [Clostridia bacterium]|nr:inorganic diphosphatase [Clostridia bacterium]MDY5264891.1 inorganic diphosphatase [Eubacteriales bacterium]MDY5440555.1 inorganic diphosphatase [Eubacteriales bacterium]